MRIAVMGTGGVGGYYGARLAAAGNEVHFVARGRHLAAIRSDGLRVLSRHGDLLIRPAQATDDPAEIGPVDLVLFCVKLFDTEAAAALCRPLIGPETAVLPLQNGIEARERIGAVLGEHHVLGGVANISAVIEAPGVIRHFDSLHVIRVGEFDNRRTTRLVACHDACAGAGLEARYLEHTLCDLWIKFAFIASVAAANCLSRLPVGPLRADPAARALLAELIGEVAAVGRARGVPLPESQVADTLATIDALPAGMRASMAVALERGERLELPWLSGAVVRFGAALGVPTPAHRVALAALSPYRDGRPAG